MITRPGGYETGYRQSSGMTLIEVMVGIALLMAVTVPLLNIYTKIGNTSKINDLRIVYSLMRGEVETMYRTNTILESEYTVFIQGTAYSLISSIEDRNGDLATWSMSARKGKISVKTLHGILYAPLRKK